jgi:hypothetical protein
MKTLARTNWPHRIGADFAGLHLSTAAIGGLIVAALALIVVGRLARVAHLNAQMARERIAAAESAAPRSGGGAVVGLIVAATAGLWLYSKTHAAGAHGAATPAATPSPQVTHKAAAHVTHAVTRAAARHLALSGTDIVLIVIIGAVVMLGVAAITRRSE